MKKKSSVAILAGGVGNRLRDRSGDLPKPMVSINNMPVLQHLITLCQKHGFTEIILLVHYRHEKISEYFGDGSGFGVSLTYLIESEPRGTAGALRDALHALTDTFIVMYGDTYMDVDLRRFWNVHLSSGAVGTLFLHPNDHPYDSDIVELSLQKNVSKIFSYPHLESLEVGNLVNAALYVLERDELKDTLTLQGKEDIAKHMLPRLIEMGHKIKGYISQEYIKDMGTPERLDKVEADILAGLPERLSAQCLRSAVFLDRDGTIIREVGHLKSPEQIDLLPDSAAAIRRLNRYGKLAVLVTNQPVVARGDVTVAELIKIHARLETKLGNSGAYLDKIYYCPHYPKKGFQGEVASLKVPCGCRKPQPGLIKQAFLELNIGQRDSWMVGDTTSDIEAGKRAGLRTILLLTGYGGKDYKYKVKPDYICSNLGEAVDWILSGHSALINNIAQIAIAANQNKRLVLVGGLARSGKSFAAQALKDLLQSLGRKAHVISLDGWLKHRDERIEGKGVCNRYNLDVISSLFNPIIRSKKREIIIEPIYDRSTRITGIQVLEHSVGPSDLIILEGVPALLIEDFNERKDSLKVFMDISPSTRLQRIKKDYFLRGLNTEETAKIIATREIDETPEVKKSSEFADFIIKLNGEF
jgi:histidinol-phosphate phosphatase family protein